MNYKTVKFSELNWKAKKAFRHGDGKHCGFSIDGDFIAILDDNGMAGEWVKVVR